MVTAGNPAAGARAHALYPSQLAHGGGCRRLAPGDLRAHLLVGLPTTAPQCQTILVRHRAKPPNRTRAPCQNHLLRPHSRHGGLVGRPNTKTREKTGNVTELSIK